MISPTLVLTCEHVVRGMRAPEIRQASGSRLACSVVDVDRELDVALLEPIPKGTRLSAESCVVPRELWRGPRLADDQAAVELCTDEADTPRSLPVELRPVSRAAARVPFGVLSGREGVRRGYSGGPVLEVDERWRVARLVGLVRARDETSVDAFDNAGAGWAVPTERIAERFDAVAALVESPVERSPAWEQHWEPRSRGVATFQEPGLFFAGRVNAYERVRAHLEDGAGLLVVTGQRGHGKSAVLARAVVLSCRRYLTLLGEAAGGLGRYTPPNESVHAAVLARGKSAAEIALELAQQQGLGPCSVQELLASVARERRAPSIVIDAVDESSDPGAVMRELVAQLCEAGARVAIGGLRRYVQHDAPATTVWVDLGRTEYGDDAIPAYVARRLRAVGKYDERTAQTVGREVARRAAGNFLVAELAARTLVHSKPIDQSAPNWADQLPRDVTDAFRDYLGRFAGDRARVLALLQPLALSRGEGLSVEPPDAWLATANMLRPDELDPFEHADLRRVSARAADYLIVRDGGSARRLYHEGLADAVRVICARERLYQAGAEPLPDAVRRELRRTERLFVDALLALLPDDEDAPADVCARLDPYLLRHLPWHLARQDQVDVLLCRPGLLLTAQQETLREALVQGALGIPGSDESARVAVVHSLARPQLSRSDRAASLCVGLRRQGERVLAERVRRAQLGQTEPVGGIGMTGAAGEEASAWLPYELICAPGLPPVLATIPDAHVGAIRALGVIAHEDQALVLSAGDDGALRSWRVDGSRGPLARDEVDSHGLLALAPLTHEGRPLVVTAGHDGHVASWYIDGSVGPLTRARAHAGRINALAVLHHQGRPLVVSAGSDRSLRSWRMDGSPGPFACDGVHPGWINALAVLDHEGQPLVVSAGDRGQLRSWQLDGSPGPLQREQAHAGRINALGVLDHAGQHLVVSAGADRALRSWRLDGSPGPLTCEDAHTRGILALRVLEYERQPLVITAGDDRALRSWRVDGSPGPLVRKHAHSGGILALAILEQAGQPLVVSASADAALRSWRVDGPLGVRASEASHVRAILALAVTHHERQPLVVSAADDGILRSWRLDGSPGQLGPTRAHAGGIPTLAVVKTDGRLLLVTAGADGALRSWWLDGSTGPLALDAAHASAIWVVAVVEHEGNPLVISGADDGSLRSWRLDGSPGPLAHPKAHAGWINAFAVFEHDGRPLVVSGGADRALRSWRLDGTPGPLTREEAHLRSGATTEARTGRSTGGILALHQLDHEGQPLVVSAGTDGALRTWRVDGSPGPLMREHAHAGAILALETVERDGQQLVVSAGADGALRTWRVDGLPGPLMREHAHIGWVNAVGVLKRERRPLLISAGDDRAILAHRLPDP